MKTGSAEKTLPIATAKKNCGVQSLHARPPSFCEIDGQSGARRVRSQERILFFSTLRPTLFASEVFFRRGCGLQTILRHLTNEQDEKRTCGRLGLLEANANFSEDLGNAFFEQVELVGDAFPMGQLL